MLKLSSVVLVVFLMSPISAFCVDEPITAPTTAPASDIAAATKEVKATIDEAIGLMDKKDYDAVLARFIPPDQLKKMKENADEYASIKKRFADEKAAEFSKALAECKAEEPTMDSAEKAVYKTSLGHDVRLTKIDGKWYIN